jgi:hypothetical protein
MNLKALFAVGVAMGGLGLGGCATEAPEDHNTRALEQGLTCNNDAGVNAMKASLAVAMAKEIGRIDPVNDLFVAWWDGLVNLRWHAKQKCLARGFGECPQTHAILMMAGPTVNNSIPQTVFNATVFRNELLASFDRQKNHEANLATNEPWRLPGTHETFNDKVSNYGACGVHYEYYVAGDKVWNLEERMPFFGGDQNPFIDFRSWDSHIAIDPTGTMEGSTTTANGLCTSVCYGYGTTLKNARGSCCYCNGKQGTLAQASWDPAMTYCKI